MKTRKIAILKLDKIRSGELICATELAETVISLDYVLNRL
jgi:hypothetical protein